MTGTTLAEQGGPAQGSRFRAARDLRGLTQAKVVARMETPISTAALSQIESGRSRPTAETVRQLARVLEVPEGFFFKPWPAGPGETEAVTFFRDLRATAQRERRKASVLAVLLEDLITALEQHVRCQMSPYRRSRSLRVRTARTSTPSLCRCARSGSSETSRYGT
jgi:transcriptional regulator with XRE-family HTH domain